MHIPKPTMNLGNQSWWCLQGWQGFPGGANGKEPTCQCRRHNTQIWSQGWEDPLEEGMATHSRSLSWRIPMDREAWWATVRGVAKSRTGLKWLSTHAHTHAQGLQTPWVFLLHTKVKKSIWLKVKVLATQSCSTLCDPHGLQPTRLLCSWNSPGKNTAVDCLFFLQGIFPTQWSYPSLQYCRQILYHLSHQGSHSIQLKGLSST